MNRVNKQQAYRFLAEPFEAPKWRARWVERMEIGASPLDGRVEA